MNFRDYIPWTTRQSLKDNIEWLRAQLSYERIRYDIQSQHLEQLRNDRPTTQAPAIPEQGQFYAYGFQNNLWENQALASAPVPLAAPSPSVDAVAGYYGTIPGTD